MVDDMRDIVKIKGFEYVYSERSQESIICR